MSTVLRAALRLEPGARLYYDCPLMSGESFKADAFFEKYRGCMATFVGYAEKLVGLLDAGGRMPGRYTDGRGISVRFDGEDEVHEKLNAQHFVCTGGPYVSLLDSLSGDDRIGDLPHPIRFYPGDFVVWKEAEHEIAEVGFDAAGAVTYELYELETQWRDRIAAVRQERSQETGAADFFSNVSRRIHACERKQYRVAVEDLSLARRGNLWALYHEPSALDFDSLDAEAAFWNMEGVTYAVTARSGYKNRALALAFGTSLEETAALFRAGEVDCIQLARAISSDEGKAKSYIARRLHESFAHQRLRVRAVQRELWSEAREGAL